MDIKEAIPENMAANCQFFDVWISLSIALPPTISLVFEIAWVLRAIDNVDNRHPMIKSTMFIWSPFFVSFIKINT